MRLSFFNANDGVNGVGLWATDSTSAGTVRLANVNVVSNGVGASVTVIDGIAYFAAQPTSGGSVTLWRSDGTAAGTYSISTVSNGSSPLNITALNGMLYFFGSDGTHTGLFKSDGTVGGVSFVADLTSASSMAVAGGKLVFQAFDGHGTELWVSDGTAAGAMLLDDIRPGGTTSQIQSMIQVGDKVFFSADDGTDGRQWWATNGTAAGTVMVSSNAVAQPGNGFANLNGEFVFGGYSSAHGYGIYASNGAAGDATLLTSVISSGQMYVAGGELFIYGSGSGGQGLYVTDGTQAGATFLTGFTKDDFSAVASGSRIYFTLDSPAYGTQLWVSDGTAAGTQVIKTLMSGGLNGTPLTNVVASGSGVTFSAYDSVHGTELWFSDGTAAGTHLLADINTTSNHATGLSISNLTGAGGKGYFAGLEGQYGQELYVTDGTVAGTHIIADQSPGTDSSYPVPLLNFGGKLVFNGGGANPGLQITDGTAVGTITISSVGAAMATVFNGAIYYSGGLANPGLYTSNGAVGGSSLVKGYISISSNFFHLGSSLLFTGVETGSVQDLYVTDGTAAGTVMIASLGKTTSIGQALNDAVVAGGKLFFAGTDNVHGQELWVSDGTSAGTHMVSDINGTSASSLSSGITPSAGSIVAFGSQVLFDAKDAGGVTSLWISDGTAGGTHALNSGTSAVFAPTVATVVGSKAYFVSNPSSFGVIGQELYVTDGSSVALVKDIRPGQLSSSPANLTAFAGKLVFSATDGTVKSGAGGISSELWISDGTADGTTIIINNGYSSYANLTVAGSELFFTNTDTSSNVTSLYATDGTVGGTHLLTTERVSGLYAVGSLLYFTGTDTVNGSELWVSDGTVAGTLRLTDTSSANGSNPYGLSTAYGAQGANDFNGDGHSDLLFSNTSTGTFSIWSITGHTAGALHEAANATAGVVDPVWQLQGALDFNGDGAADLVWRNTATGAFSIWDAAKSGFTQNAYSTGAADNSYAMAGFGDFNGDGKDDILFRNASGAFTEWTSNGTGFTQNAYVNGGVDASWHIQAVADFNGDGKADILWRSTGGGFNVNTYVNTAVDTSWHVAAVADFNGDGRADLLLRNDSGVFTEWQSTGAGFTANVYGDATVGNDWHLQGAFDFNGDGKADLLWRNDAGAFSVWTSTGSSFTPNALTEGSVGSDYAIVTHHYDIV